VLIGQSDQRRGPQAAYSLIPLTALVERVNILGQF
jgi:hypothetical protein